jgi:hypothetical protein
MPRTSPLRGRSVVIGLLWLSAVVTLLYWVAFFTSGDVQSSEAECYLVFERAFPAADSWLAAACVAAAEGLRRRREWAVPFGIAAGSAAVYLGCMDVLYNLENGMYSVWSAPMAGEILINLFCLTFGPFLLVWFWKNRRGVESVA